MAHLWDWETMDIKQFPSASYMVALERVQRFIVEQALGDNDIVEIWFFRMNGGEGVCGNIKWRKVEKAQ